MRQHDVKQMTHDTAPVHPTPASLRASSYDSRDDGFEAQQKPVEMTIAPEIAYSIPGDDIVGTLH